MAKFRIINTTNRVSAPGFFLDLGESFGASKFLGVGKSVTFDAADVNEIPDFITEWVKKGYALIQDSSGATAGGAETYGEITPAGIHPVSEVAASDIDTDDFMDDEPDLTQAQDAALPKVGASLGVIESTKQMQTAKVSLGMETERYANDDSALSPIPGDIPRSVDDSGRFTVKAPRHSSPGGVIGK